jgi:hypothetical protein
MVAQGGPSLGGSSGEGILALRHQIRAPDASMWRHDGVFASKLPSLQTATAPAANFPLALEASPSPPTSLSRGATEDLSPRG